MIVTGSLSWGNGIKYHLKSNVEIKFVKRRDKVAKKSAKKKNKKKPSQITLCHPILSNLKSALDSES